MKNDPRIGKVALVTIVETPTTMARNKAVKLAQDGKYDFLLMLDSDNVPDCERFKPFAHWKPFWNSSFDFAYDRMQRKRPTVVCAPYCNVGIEENVFVFYWEGSQNGPNSPVKFAQYSRHAASAMAGIQPVAAGPTGMTLYSVDAFDLTSPPYFYYEYNDKEETHKCSTEDVTNFRDINLNGHLQYGEPIVFCNWDAWAGHNKPSLSTKPNLISSHDVNRRYREAVEKNLNRDETLVDLDYGYSDPDCKIPNVPIPTIASCTVTKEDCSAVDKDGGYHSPWSNTETGVLASKRTIFGRVTTFVGHATSDANLGDLNETMGTIVKERGGTAVRALEVGSWCGESAVALASALRDDGSVLYCVDDFSGGPDATEEEPADLLRRAALTVGADKIREYWHANTNGLPVRLMEGKSLDIAASIDNAGLDFVYIDASHTYENCLADIQAWLPHVADHGYIGGDDYMDCFPGVKRAVKEVFIDAGAHVSFKGTFWLVSKQEYLECLKSQA